MVAPFRSPTDPPYVAVVFTSIRRAEGDGYERTAVEMDHLAAAQPGYLGVDSVREPGSRLGITVSYWRSEEDALAWKNVTEHVAARRRGRDEWYESYSVHIATVTRAYGAP
ncbi:MAG: antibiotic biosynthesis monooxygenase [Acidimicrobiia bacterium]